MTSPRRPKIVTILSLGVLTFGVVNVIAIRAWLQLPDIELTVPTWYLPLRNGLWASAAIISAIALFLGKKWAPRFTRWTSLLIASWYVIDHLLIKSSEYAARSFPSRGLVTAFLVITIFWVLGRESSRDYFRENPHE